MSYKIIGDSCTDLTDEMKKEGFVSLVPLTLSIEGEEFIDDESTFVPGTFFIMNYDSFEKEFKNFDGKLSTPLLIRERHNAK